MSQSTSTGQGGMKVRAIHDFDPKEMSSREKIELINILKKGGLKKSKTREFEENTDFDGEITSRKDEQELNGTHEGRNTSESEEEQTVNEQQQKEAKLKKEGSSRWEGSELKEAAQDFELFRHAEKGNSKHYASLENQQEISEIEELEMAVQELNRDEENVKTENRSDESSATEHDADFSPVEQEDNRSTSTESDESYHSEGEVDPYAEALAFKRGDAMTTLSPANIGDIIGWWIVKHSTNGHIGFIPRNYVVLAESDQQPSNTTVNELPLELLDIILQNSFLHWTLNSSKYKRYDEVITALASVNFCWFQRIITRRIKKRIWQQQKVIYERRRKIPAIIRNNKTYLMETIQTNDELIALLSSLNCVTEVQRHVIQRQRSERDKNAELLHIARSFDELKFSSFVQCLRQVRQKTVARIAETGGGVIKVHICNRGATYKTFLDAHQLHRTIDDLRNRTKARPYRTEKFVSQLNEAGIEILGSQLDRQAVIVWIWCQTQSAIEHIKKLYESNQLSDVFASVANIPPSAPHDIIHSNVINVDSNQLKKTLVACPIIVNFTERLDVGEDEEVMGIDKLRGKIFVLCRSLSFSSPTVLRVFEDRNLFLQKNKFRMKEIKHPKDIGSCEKENCLYVSDSSWKIRCVWKLTTVTDDKYEINKWLTVDYEPEALSVSSDGQFIVVSRYSSILRIYGSDATLLRSIQLPGDLKEPRHAVETSIGNYIILHKCTKENVGRSGSDGLVRETGGVCELTRDGQMIIRRFIPSNETQNLIDPRYLSLDSDDRVFVADHGAHRVILLDSELRWGRILCPTDEENEERNRIDLPKRLFYDEEKRQLIVGRGGHLLGREVHIYSINRK